LPWQSRCSRKNKPAGTVRCGDCAQVREPEVGDAVHGPDNKPRDKSEKVLSRFKIGNLEVSEIKIDHNIDELFVESSHKGFEGKDLSLLRLEDLFEPEKAVKKPDRHVKGVQDTNILEVFLKRKKRSELNRTPSATVSRIQMF
jgi:hypothetical protein